MSNNFFFCWPGGGGELKIEMTNTKLTKVSESMFKEWLMINK